MSSTNLIITSIIANNGTEGKETVGEQGPNLAPPPQDHRWVFVDPLG
jgi:hypothetical protein